MAVKRSNRGKRGKRGYYFSIDAMVAVILIVTGIILASTFYVQESKTTNILHYSQDLVGLLSTIKLYELNSSLVASLFASGVITDVNKTLLDQAGEFWAQGNISLAEQLLNLTAGIIQPQFKYGVFFDGEFVYGNNESAPSAIVSSKRLVSGVSMSKPVEGFAAKAQLKSFTAKAQLTSFQARNTFAYAYFGGFVGEGNITTRIVLPATFSNVTSAYLELDPSDNFTLYINNNFAGYYGKGSGGGGNASGAMLADKWTINNTYLQNFVPGANYVNFTFNFSMGYVGGGFLRVGYTTSALNDSEVSFFQGLASERYYFPRIEGLVNLYDSFFVPGNISTLTALLHYTSDYNTFLTIGNVTVFSLNAGGEQIVDLADSGLAVKLNYTALSSDTVPLRLGSGTGNTTTLATGNANVVLANDLSGSMEYCTSNACSAVVQGNENYCGTNHPEKPSIGTYCNYTQENYILPNGSAACSYRWHALCPANDTRKLDIAVNASRQFVTVLLGSLGNKMGIVGFTNPAPSVKVLHQNGSWPQDTFDPFPDSIVSYENLTGNAQTIISNINSYMDSYFESCLCCGVVKAEQILNNDTTPGRFKSMVVMSDGEATDKCTGVGSGNAKSDAIKAANQSCTNSNISVNTVAFGSEADAETLKAMACNNGSFYNASNLADLIAVYNKVASDINKISYKEQVISFAGGLANESILYGDSFIEYNYTPDFITVPNVIPITLESQRFGNNISEATLNLPANRKLSQAKVTSYSSDKWTDNLTVSNSVANRQAFSLGQFGDNYYALGDPFVVYAKPGIFESGNNLVHISTATSPGNYSGGSPDDIIIYTLLVPNLVGNGGAFSKIDGCLWHVTFEDGTSTTIAVPKGYSGPEECFFSPPDYTPDDAMDDAIFRLLKVLDFDGNGLLDVKFEADDLGVGISSLSSVPSLWGPAVADVRVWQ